MDSIIRQYNEIEQTKKDIEKLSIEIFNMGVVCKTPFFSSQTTPKKWTLSVDYFITVTLKPILYSKPSELQFSLTAQKLFDTLKGKCRDIKLTLISEETKSLNVHYHGIISVPSYVSNNPRRWIIDRLRISPFGRVDVEQIDNFQNVSNYIQKDIKKDYPYYPIVCDDYNIITN